MKFFLKTYICTLVLGKFFFNVNVFIACEAENA